MRNKIFVVIILLVLFSCREKPKDGYVYILRCFNNEIISKVSKNLKDSQIEFQILENKTSIAVKEVNREKSYVSLSKMSSLKIFHKKPLVNFILLRRGKDVNWFNFSLLNDLTKEYYYFKNRNLLSKEQDDKMRSTIEEVRYVIINY